MPIGGSGEGKKRKTPDACVHTRVGEAKIACRVIVCVGKYGKL